MAWTKVLAGLVGMLVLCGSFCAAQPVSFTCIDHPEVSLPAFGRCPVCGIDLLPAGKAGTAPAVGEKFRVPDGTAVVREVDITRVVANDYSRRFRFDSCDNPKLKRLREQEKLDEAVAGGADEFDRQVRLLDWVYRRVKKFGTPTANPRGALEIFKAVDEGHTFFCAHYASALVSCAASLGWIARPLGLRIGVRQHGTGAEEHSAVEMWSNQFDKWVFFDPTYASYVEKNGVPLSAWEVRQEWFYGDPEKLAFVIGKERKKYRLADMPIFRATHAGFGDLALGPRTIDKLAFIMFIPNTDLMDSPPDYEKAFIVKDDTLCEGIRWHRRDNPKDPATEPYFPLNQADMTVVFWQGDEVKVWLRTNTPNFKTFRLRIDGKKWADCGRAFSWNLHKGVNTCETVSVNAFGVEGHPSKVIIEVR